MQKPTTLSGNLFDPYTIDSIDYDIHYMERVVDFDWWEDKWTNYNTWFVNTALPTIIPNVKDGIVLFVGVYTGEDFAMLKDSLPNCDVIGVDAVNYSNHKIIVDDVRHFLDNYDNDISMMWDGIGPWPWSMNSKTSCFLYAKERLVSGGLYYSHLNTKNDNPKILEDESFKVIDSDFLLMEKI